MLNLRLRQQNKKQKSVLCFPLRVPSATSYLSKNF